MTGPVSFVDHWKQADMQFEAAVQSHSTAPVLLLCKNGGELIVPTLSSPSGQKTKQTACHPQRSHTGCISAKGVAHAGGVKRGLVAMHPRRKKKVNSTLVDLRTIC
jgi:hypothetical protein